MLITINYKFYTRINNKTCYYQSTRDLQYIIRRVDKVSRNARERHLHREPAASDVNHSSELWQFAYKMNTILFLQLFLYKKNKSF